MSKRDEALEELRKQIAAQRARLDPKVLKMAEQAARLSQTAGGPDAASLVPYDREAAAAAIRLFLQQHDDAAGFEKKLLDMIDRLKH